MILWSDYQLSEWVCLFDLKEQERSEKESRSVSSKEAWTCHPLSEPLILPPELLPSEEEQIQVLALPFFFRILPTIWPNFLAHKISGTVIIVVHQRWRSKCDGSYICKWQEQLGTVCYNRDLTDWLNTRKPNWSLFFKQAMHHNQVDWEPSSNDHEQKSRATAPCLFAGDEITKL